MFVFGTLVEEARVTADEGTTIGSGRETATWLADEAVLVEVGTGGARFATVEVVSGFCTEGLAWTGAGCSRLGEAPVLVLSDNGVVSPMELEVVFAVETVGSGAVVLALEASLGAGAVFGVDRERALPDCTGRAAFGTEFSLFSTIIPSSDTRLFFCTGEWFSTSNSFGFSFTWATGFDSRPCFIRFFICNLR